MWSCVQTIQAFTYTSLGGSCIRTLHLKHLRETIDKYISNWTNFAMQNLVVVCRQKHLRTYIYFFNFVTLKRDGNLFFFKSSSIMESFADVNLFSLLLISGLSRVISQL